MDSKLLLAGTIAVIFVVGLGLTPAFAQQTNIDNFDESDDVSCDKTIADPGGAVPAQDGPTTDFGPSTANTVGGFRTCTTVVTLDDSGVASAECMTEVADAPGIGKFPLDSSDEIDCFTILKYGSMASPLNQDWSAFSKIRLNFSSFDASNMELFFVNITLTDFDSFFSINQSISIAGAQNVDVSLPTYMANGIDLTDVDMLTVTLDPFTAGDFTLQNIFIPVEIGGTIMPADTTALMLAGAKVNAMWILPVIAAIGIGAFVVSRKRK